MAFRMGFRGVVNACSKNTFHNTPIRTPLATYAGQAQPQAKLGGTFSYIQHYTKNMTKDKLFTASSVLMAISLPAGLLTAPSVLSVPFDAVLSIALPIHMYIGARHIMEDYVPKAIRPQVLTGWAGLAALSSLGLLKISMCGPGISYSMKSLWYPVHKKDIKE